MQAVDGSALAIEILSERAAERKLAIDARVSDLERGEFEIEPEAYELICDCLLSSAQPDPEDASGSSARRDQS